MSQNDCVFAGLLKGWARATGLACAGLVGALVGCANDDSIAASAREISGPDPVFIDGNPS